MLHLLLEPRFTRKSERWSVWTLYGFNTERDCQFQRLIRTMFHSDRRSREFEYLMLYTQTQTTHKTSNFIPRAYPLNKTAKKTSTMHTAPQYPAP
jgi:hypothetical protein